MSPAKKTTAKPAAKSTSRSHTKNGSAANKKNEKANNHSSRSDELTLDILSVISLSIGVFVLFCVVSPSSGVVCSVIAKTLLRLFGTAGSLIFALCIIISGLLSVLKYEPIRTGNGKTFLYILSLNLIVISSLISDVFKGYKINEKSFYNMIWETDSPGGCIGAFLSKLFSEYLSVFGAWLLVISILVVSFMAIFHKGIKKLTLGKGEQVTVKIKEADAKTKKGAEALMRENLAVSASADVRSRKRAGKEEAQTDGGFEEYFAKLDSQSTKKDRNIVRITPLDTFAGAKLEGKTQKSRSKQQPDTLREDTKIIKNNPFITSDDAKQALSKDDKREISKSIADKSETDKSALGEANTSYSENSMVSSKGDNTKSERTERKKESYVFPPLKLLDISKSKATGAQRSEILEKAAHLKKTLSDFGIEARVSEICMGPTVTRYEMQLQSGIRVSKVVSLSDDLAMALAAQRVRIEAPIPGKSAIGIEVPNKEIAVVKFSDIVSSPEFLKSTSPLAVALGKTISGENLIMDITRMPHLLIAGQTGSGKSVCIHTIIASVLYHSAPSDVKLIMIDPKMVELNMYESIPHLLIPVVTDPKYASQALAWAVRTMTGRYEAFFNEKVKDIAAYNARVTARGEEKMPHIMIIIDELSDLMMVSPQSVEASICRLAQLARAAGIHLVLATQRPSVNVITGLIKANIPARISFAVSSQIDSRTILDMGGAENLLGRGDMLYKPPEENKPMRAQCSYISENEIESIVEFIKQKSEQSYNEDVIEEIAHSPAEASGRGGANASSDGFDDELIEEAMAVAFEKGEISTSHIQRRLKIGYARAGRIVDEMEQRGFVSGPNGSKPRKVLISKEEFNNSGE